MKTTISEYCLMTGNHLRDHEYEGNLNEAKQQYIEAHKGDGGKTVSWWNLAENPGDSLSAILNIKGISEQDFALYDPQITWDFFSQLLETAIDHQETADEIFPLLCKLMNLEFGWHCSLGDGDGENFYEENEADARRVFTDKAFDFLTDNFEIKIGVD